MDEVEFEVIVVVRKMTSRLQRMNKCFQLGRTNETLRGLEMKA